MIHISGIYFICCHYGCMVYSYTENIKGAWLSLFIHSLQTVKLLLWAFEQDDLSVNVLVNSVVNPQHRLPVRNPHALCITKVLDRRQHP